MTDSSKPAKIPPQALFDNDKHKVFKKLVELNSLYGFVYGAGQKNVNMHDASTIAIILELVEVPVEMLKELAKDKQWEGFPAQ